MLNATTPTRFTRREAVKFLKEQHGIPLTYSTLKKLCALGEGPEPDECWGRYELFTGDTLLSWVRKRLRPATRRNAT